MKIDNYYTAIQRTKKHFADAQDVTTYEQHIHILGARMESADSVLVVYYDKSHFASKDAHTYVGRFSLGTGALSVIQQLPYTTSGFQMGTNVYYSSGVLGTYTGECLFTVEDEVINAVCESQLGDIFLIATNLRLMVVSSKLQLISESPHVFHSLVNVSKSPSYDQFYGMQKNDNATRLREIILQRGTVRVEQVLPLINALGVFSVELCEAQQLCVSIGVQTTFNIDVLYYNYMGLGDFGEFGNFNHYVHGLGCFNVAEKVTHYMYPTVAPVIQVQASKYMFEIEENVFVDLVCFADAAGFLHLSTGCTTENVPRIFSIQTNAWVKSIQLFFKETESSEGVDMLKINNFVAEDDKRCDVKVEDNLQIFVQCQSEAVRGGMTLQVDGFSIINISLKKIKEIIQSDMCEEDEADGVFSYLDVSMQNSLHEPTDYIEENDETFNGELGEAEEEEENGESEPPAAADALPDEWAPAEVEVKQTDPVHVLFNDTLETLKNVQLIKKLADGELRKKAQKAKQDQDLKLLLQQTVSGQTTQAQPQGPAMVAPPPPQHRVSPTAEQTQHPSLPPSQPQEKVKKPKKIQGDSIIAELDQPQADKTGTQPAQTRATAPQPSQPSSTQQTATKQVAQLSCVLMTKDNQELRVIQVFEQTGACLISFQGNQFLTSQVPRQIILTPRSIYVRLPNSVIKYGRTGEAQDKVDIAEEILLAFAPRCFVPNNCFFYEMEEEPEIVYIMTHVGIISLPEGTNVSVKIPFRQLCGYAFETRDKETRFIVAISDQTQLFVVNQADQRLEMLSNIGFLQDLILDPAQFRIYLNLSGIPAEVYAQCIKTSLNRTVNRLVYAETESLQQLQQVTLIQLLIEQGLQEKKFLNSPDLFQLAVNTIKDIYPTLTPALQLVIRSYVVASKKEVLQALAPIIL